MRPYNDKEIAIFKRLEKQAELSANQAHGVSPNTESEKNAWSRYFHAWMEREAVALGLRIPREVFGREEV